MSNTSEYLIPNEFKRNRKLTAKIIDDINTRYLAGESYANIAKRYNISSSTVRYHVNNKYNIRVKELAKIRNKTYKKPNPKENYEGHIKWKRLLIDKGNCIKKDTIDEYEKELNNV